jgi:hypothetical protein
MNRKYIGCCTCKEYRIPICIKDHRPGLAQKGNTKEHDPHKQGLKVSSLKDLKPPEHQSYDNIKYHCGY